MRLLYSCLPSSDQENSDGVLTKAINSVVPTRRAMYDPLDDGHGEGENQRLLSSRPANPTNDGYEGDGALRQMYGYLWDKVSKGWSHFTEYEKIQGEEPSTTTPPQTTLSEPLHGSYQADVGPSVPLTYHKIETALDAKASGCCEKCCTRLEQIKAIIKKAEFPQKARTKVWKSLKNNEVAEVYQIIRKAGFTSELRATNSTAKVEEENVDVHMFYL